MTDDTEPRVVVRQFRCDDVAAMIDIFRSAVREIASRDYTQAQVVAWAPDVIDAAAWAARCAGRHTFIAAIDHHPVGFTELESNGHLDMLYVDARHQGVGIASALVSQVERTARKQRTAQLFTEASKTARPFFESRGFAVIATQTVARRGQQFINYRMAKVL